MGRLRAILDYDAWDTVHAGNSFSMGDGTLRQTVEQDVPLRYPFHRAFYAADSISLSGQNDIDEHFSLYLDEEGL